jgi:glycolate oxidase iron-sulfur subunit
MLHSIPTAELGPLGEPMARAVSACVHCGFCLAACPTYRELGQEMDSPRGRIVLMKEVLEGTLAFADARPHIDRCLGCLACEPACPSGVPYRDLISPFRTLAAAEVKRPPLERLRRLLMSRIIPHPRRFRLAMRLGRIAKAFVPSGWSPMLDLVPRRIPPPRDWTGTHPARGERRARVALLAGCAQRVLDPDINTATLAVLAHQGVEVVVPAGQGCCGGLAWHTGDLAAARSFARRNLEAFPADVDAVLTNAAGCGSAMHVYALLLRGTPDEARAAAFAARVVDVSAFLLGLGWRGSLREVPQKERPFRVAYHDACHLANAQGVRTAPRELLRSLPGLELIELADAHLCCGSAGTYNLDEPRIAASLGREKARRVIESGAAVVATGNIGCLTQLQAHLDALGSGVEVRHTMQVLRDGIR